MAIVSARSVLFEKDYRPLFSGHETFPLRQGWLKKVVDAARGESEPEVLRPGLFGEDAIARYGVGKNMVSAMRHWAVHCGVLSLDGDQPTALGKALLGERGVDPYLEHPASLWLFHWKLCSGESGRVTKTTWFWAFNHFTATTFTREDLVDGLMKFASAQAWPRLSRTTVQRDVECFVRTYEGSASGKGGSVEDGLESALSELGLIRGHRSRFQFVRGAKRSLPDGVFAFALNSFWERYAPNASSLSFEACAHAPGSPGRVFLLDENELSSRLAAVDEATDGRIRWSETAGLKQLVRSKQIDEAEALDFALTSYGLQRRRGR